MRSNPRSALSALMLAMTLVACSDAKPKKKSSPEDDKPANRSSSAAVQSSSSGPAPTQTATQIVIGPPGQSGVIAYDPNGPNKLDDSKLKGDAKTCATVKACCDNQSGALALGCQLALTDSNGDCSKMLATVKPLASELGKPPAGCQ